MVLSNFNVQIVWVSLVFKSIFLLNNEVNTWRKQGTNVEENEIENVHYRNALKIKVLSLSRAKFITIITNDTGG